MYLLLKAVGFVDRGLIARIRCIRDLIRLRLRFRKDALLFIHDCLRLHDSVRQNDAQLTNQVDDFARIDKAQRLGHGNAARVIDSVFELIDDPTRLRDAVACRLTVFFADGSGFLLLVHLVFLPYLRNISAISTFIIHFTPYILINMNDGLRYRFALSSAARISVAVPSGTIGVISPPNAAT